MRTLALASFALLSLLSHTTAFTVSSGSSMVRPTAVPSEHGQNIPAIVDLDQLDKDSGKGGAPGYPIPNPTISHEDDYHVKHSNGSFLRFKHPTLTRRGAHDNDYKTTPTPGLYLCTKPDFEGDCWWSGVAADPKICQQLAPKYYKEISLGVDHDLQVSIHSSKNCDGGHTPGVFYWPGVPRLRAGDFGMGGDMMAYRARKAPGIWDDNFPVWDGTATGKVSNGMPY